MAEKISIITISYNSKNTIEKTILSILGQSYRPLEYVFVDGGSKDGTINLIKKYIPELEKAGIEVNYKSEPDHGISDAFNKGIQRSSGDIIGIINSDDQLMDEALVKIADAFTPTVRLLDNGTLSFKVVFITIGIIYTISYVLCVDKSYVSIERDSLFKWIYYFAVMMLGFYCKKKKRSNAQNKVSLLIVCSAMFVIFYGLQFVIKRCTVLLPFQFIIHVEEVVFIYYITYLFENLESFFIKIKHKTAISKIADSLAKITLEIYLVQMVVIDLCAEL